MKTPIVFLSALLLSAGIMSAQAPVPVPTPSPGGVKAPEAWFKTVPDDPDDLQGDYRWEDFSGDEIPFIDPSYGGDFKISRDSIHTYNFNPALYFSGKNMDITLKKAGLSQTTIIGLWGFKRRKTNDDGFLYNVNREENEEFLLNKKSVTHSLESGREPWEYNPNFTTQGEEKRISILSYCGGIRPNYSIWGRAKSSVINIGGVLDAQNSSKYDPEVNNDNNEGYCPEFIVYNRVLTTKERLQVESYLAIKYGITIDDSYLNSKGDTIWDKNKNGSYKNRITGYMRDEASGLYQRVSTTSYEEGQLDIDDTYHNKNSYNRSSGYNLLVIGKQDGVEMEDGDYVLFADNGQPAGIRSEDADKGVYEYKRMARTWKLRTNIPAQLEEYVGSWNYENVSVSYSNYPDYDLQSLVVETGNPVEHAYSKTPLMDDNGSFSFFCFGIYPSRMLKFGSQSSELEAYDYGYFMDDDMNFFKIEKGQIKSGSFAVYNEHYDSKVEICKEGNTIFLRVNHVRIPQSDIIIAPNDLNRDYYGNVIQSKGIGFSISGFQHNGFINAGNRIELSGDLTVDSIFGKYPNRSVYLAVDSSGTGNFEPEDTYYIQMDEFDRERSKIIFNNVFWDADSTGTDAFTFALMGEYGEDDPQPADSATITVKDPSCDENNYALSNGEITVLGDGYYSMVYCYPVDNPDDIKTAINNIDNPFIHTIQGLAQHTYKVIVSKTANPAFDFTATGTQARAMTYGNPSSESYYVSWTIFDPRIDATIAFTSSTDLSGNLTWSNGVKMENGNLYTIVDGYIDYSTPVTLGMGVPVTISIGDGYMEIFTTRMLSQPVIIRGGVSYDPNQPLAVELADGEIIAGLTFSDGFTPANLLDRWQTTATMEAVPVGIREYEVALDAGCPDNSIVTPPVTDDPYQPGVTDPSCGQNNGEILLTEGYNYQLIKSDGTVTSPVYAYSNYDKLTGLAAGSYTLMRTPRSNNQTNFSFWGSGVGSYAISNGTFETGQQNNSFIEWTVSNLTGNATVAMMLEANNTVPVFNYGVHISGNKLYTITNFIESTDPVIINQGDRIRLERNGNAIIVRIVNTGTLVGTLQINQPDWYKNAQVAVLSSGSAISNLTVSSNFRYYDANNLWNASSMMAVTSGQTQVYSITLQDNCQSLRSATAGSLATYVRNSNTKGFTAELTLVEPEDATLRLYNSTGVLIGQKELPASATKVETDFDVPASGVYLVNAMTDSGKEYSRKVVIP